MRHSTWNQPTAYERNAPPDVLEGVVPAGPRVPEPESQPYKPTSPLPNQAFADRSTTDCYPSHQPDKPASLPNQAFAGGNQSWHPTQQAGSVGETDDWKRASAPVSDNVWNKPGNVDNSVPVFMSP